MMPIAVKKRMMPKMQHQTMTPATHRKQNIQMKESMMGNRRLQATIASSNRLILTLDVEDEIAEIADL
jgi:hypothetical protein